MDRAAKVVRRSGVKLLSLGGGHSDLNMVLSELKDVRNAAKSFMASQSSASEYMLKWASGEDNRAIQDVANQVAEMNLLWTEVQRDFLEQIRDFRHTFDMILEGERHLNQAKTNLVTLEQRENKVKRDLKKAAKKGMTDEVRGLESRYMQAERARALAQIELADSVRETEAVKMLRFKDALLRISDAYEDMAHKCAIIFRSQREISEQIPDLGTHDIEDVKYVGAGQTKRYVVQARERLKQHKRQRAVTATSHTQGSEEPPPPYSSVDLHNYSDYPVTVDLCPDYTPCPHLVQPSPLTHRPSSPLDQHPVLGGDRGDMELSPAGASGGRPAPSERDVIPPSTVHPLDTRASIQVEVMRGGSVGGMGGRVGGVRWEDDLCDATGDLTLALDTISLDD